MQKKFIQNLVFLLFLNILVKPFWLLAIDRGVQNAVGHEEYGLYFALFNFTFLFQILLDFGINSFNNRNIAQYPILISKYFSSIISLKILLVLLYLLFIVTLGLILGYTERSFKLMLFLAFNMVLASYISYLRSNISALHHFKTDSIFSVMDKALMIFLCGIALWTDVLGTDFRIEWFIYIQSISYFITAFLAFIFVHSKAGFFRFRFNFLFFRLIIKNSYPFALLSIFIAVYTRIDGVMIERMLADGKNEAGIYASGYRILDAFNMIAFLFGTLLLPIFSRMIKNREDVVPLVKTSFSLFLYPAFIIVVACFCFRHEIMNVLYHVTGDYNARIFGFLMLNFLSMGSVYIFGALLTANNSLRFLNIISCAGMISNIFLNYLLIPKYHAYGAVLATLITQSVISLLQILKSLKLFHISFSFNHVFKAGLFAIIILILFSFFMTFEQNWVLNMFIPAVLGFLIVFVFKLVNIKDLIRFLLPG
jgi:O-antigen/teichoic acid export membrane protein